MEGSYDYNKWISTYEIYWEDKSLIPVVAAFTPPPHLRIKIFDLGKNLEEMFACQKINGVGKLNFYKDGGIKGVSGAILTLKNPMHSRLFLPMLSTLLYNTVSFISSFILKCTIFFITAAMYKNK